MEPRLRAGLIAGGGAAISTLLLSLVFPLFCGPFIAIIGGLSAGMQIARDPRFARNATGAAAIAGVYAGILVGIAQVVGMVLFLTTPTGQQTMTQAITQYPIYTSATLWLALIIFSLFLALLDVGIMAGSAAIIAHNLTRAAVAPRHPYAPPADTPTYYVPMPGMQPAPPPAPPTYVPPSVVKTYAPPPTYPPPPSYYGFPDVASPDAPDADASPPDAADA